MITRFICLSLFLSSPVWAADTARPLSSAAIIAVVNDEAITQSDLDARLRFVFSTTALSSSPESVARIKPQIIRALIDERLQLQEARKNKITLVDKEVEQAVAGIESQRQMAPGSVLKMLNGNHIPEDTFYNQVKAQIVWSKLLSRKVSSKIQISDEDIEQMVRKISKPVMKQELQIALLQLPVDKQARDAEVRNAAEKMVLEVRAGANFEELSRQFAGGAAREGGKLPSFWVRSEQLDPVIADALKNAKKGDVTMPIRNSEGYTIIKVYDARDLAGAKPSGTEITFKEVTLKLRSSSSEKEMEALKTIAEEISKHPGACKDKSVAGIENASFASIDVKQTISMKEDLPPALKVIADGLKLEEMSTPFASDEGVKLYQLCGKNEGVDAPVDRDRAKNAVYGQRMELEAQRYMRNLRRDAFIEVR